MSKEEKTTITTPTVTTEEQQKPQNPSEFPIKTIIVDNIKQV